MRRTVPLVLLMLWTVSTLSLWQVPFTQASPPASAGVQARAASEFYNSLGVGINIANYTSEEGYRDVTRPALLELGIRHVRIGLDIYPDSVRSSALYTRCRDLAALGFRFNAIAGSMPTSWNAYTPSVVSKIPDAFDWCNGAIETLEGINEPNLQNVADWVPRTREFQRQLYEIVQRTPRLANVQVVGPSPVMLNAGGELGDISAWTDYGNGHPYYGDRNPGTPGWGGIHFGARYGSLEYQLGYAAQNTRNQPVFMTETGYSTFQDDAGVALPQDVKAQYILRTYLRHFANDVPRTFVYTLVNGDPSKPKDRESHFGLVMNDGTRLPSFKLLKALVGIVQGGAGSSGASYTHRVFLPTLAGGGGSGAVFTPGRLAYQLGGATANVEHLLLQRPDGHFLLPIWLEVPAWEPDARQRIAVPTQAVSLTLPPEVQQVRLHSFNGDGSVSTRTLTPQAGVVNLRLGAELQLLEIR